MKKLIGLFIVCFFSQAIVASADLFEKEAEKKEMSKEMFKSLQKRVRIQKILLKQIEELRLMVKIMSMQKGDCSPAVEIEGKAKSGDSDSQWLLASLYGKGLCVGKSKSKKVEWLKKSAAQGHEGATTDLAKAYLLGQGVERNPSQAKILLEGNSKRGNGESAWLLGNMYFDGNGITQNTQKAIGWYKRALKLGYQQAGLSLGILFLQGGRGIKSDPLIALRYLMPIAENGNQAAQVFASLAISVKRNPIREDLVEAHKWANLGSTAKNKKVSDLGITQRTNLEKVMTRKEIQKSQQKASSWKPISKARFAAPQKSNDLPYVNSHLADKLSKEKARAKLIELNVPITKQAFRKAIEKDNIGLVKLFNKAGARVNTRIGLNGQTAIYIPNSVAI